MGLSIFTIRSWWQGELDLDAETRRRAADLIEAHRYDDAHDLAAGILPDPQTLDPFFLRPSMDLAPTSSEIVFLTEFLEVYGDDALRNGPLLAALLSLRATSEGVVSGDGLHRLRHDLRSAEALGRGIQVPSIDHLHLAPAMTGRWLLDPGCGPLRPERPCSIFVEADGVVFYPEPWRQDSRWDPAKAVKLHAPSWDRSTFSYVDTASGQSFHLPWMAEAYQALEATYQLDDDGLYVDQAKGTAALPDHPLWDGEAQIVPVPALGFFADALADLEKALDLLDGGPGVIQLS
ncbi:MAG: hypothetical protein AAGN66_05030 [Acidobacteriota bacterium]